MNDEQLLRYSRHIMLPEIDIAGQAKLLSSHVLIIGAGGLGCPAAMYLASSGIGQLTLSDGDTIDITNLQRQIAYTTGDIGCLKSKRLKEKLLMNNPDITIHTVGKLSKDELALAINKSNVVLDCSDNFETRYTVNEICVNEKVPLISGSAINFMGQLSTFLPSKGSPCYQCIYPDASLQKASCNESGVIAPAVGIIGTLQALEAIKLITEIGKVLVNQLLLFDALNLSFKTIATKPDKHCAICEYKRVDNKATI